jgi:glycerol-3-phosphate O-acyltransferase / dihydroxyacetone phosphate acyltransferase
MWLLPTIDRVASFAARTYYRLTVAGEAVPRSGPVLLVANHPNSLLDPALVAAAARRPVRFLAKEPLFRDPAVSWLVRGAGAIPVYRTQDDPGSVGRNEEAFRAAHEALREGAAVGIFPEGISHHLPALAPLKTGAARIALGAAALTGGAFPIVPVGLTFRDKERFRSDALALVGRPVEWSDLAHPDAGAAEVRELTSRIAAALDAQTVNLGSWEDAPLVATAAEIYAVGFGLGRDPASRVAAEREATRILLREREAGTGAWEAVAGEVRRHGRVLRSLGLRPADLGAVPGAATAARWTLRQLAYLLVFGILGVLGIVLFYPPYRATGAVIARIGGLTPDGRSTYVVMGGALLFLIWIVLLALGAGLLAGWPAGAAALLALPPLAVYARIFRDRWRDVSGTARRFLLLRPREALRQTLQQRQDGIAGRLEEMRERHRAADTSPISG